MATRGFYITEQIICLGPKGGIIRYSSVFDVLYTNQVLFWIFDDGHVMLDRFI